MGQPITSDGSDGVWVDICEHAINISSHQPPLALSFDSIHEIVQDHEDATIKVTLHNSINRAHQANRYYRYSTILTMTPTL